MKNVTLHSIIQNRRSPVVFSDQLVEPEKIKLLFESARWAPSSMNEQPWRFIFATRENPDQFKKFFDCLAPGNHEWNKTVPLLILGVTKSNFDYKNRPNKHSRYDLGSATANLTFQANSMDLWVHQMGGFDPEQAKQSLNIPDGFDPVVMLAVGYLGDIEKASDNLKKREQSERKRKPLSEIVFEGSWGDSVY